MSMYSTRIRRAAVAVAAAAVLPIALTACSDSGDKDTKAADSTPSAKASTSDDAMKANEPFGPACSSVPKSGAGSFDGMAKDPVATAASNNPDLSTLVTAVKKAGLVDTLNNAKNLTVFAPTNDAFAKIPQADLDKVLNDKAQLTKILTYHVVGQAEAAAAGERLLRDAGEEQAHHRGLRHRVQGQRHVERRLRQRPDGQRHGLHRRHGPDAEELTDTAECLCRIRPGAAQAFGGQARERNSFSRRARI